VNRLLPALPLLLLACASTVGGASLQRADATADTPATPDAADVTADTADTADAACVPSPAIDGDGRVMRNGSEARYVVRAAEMRPGRAELDADGCGPRGGATHTFSLRVTAQRRAWLRVSLEGLGTQASEVDRIVVLRGCGAQRARLACGAGDVPFVRAQARVDPGEAVTIAVGMLPRDVVVRVVEVTVVHPAGEVCDRDEGRDVCAAGAHCLRDVCVPDGVLEGACRRAARPCDDGLTCVGGTTEGPTGVCLRAVRPGDPCVLGDTCVGGACPVIGVPPVCIAAGTLGGSCRDDAPRCDGSLTCARDRNSAGFTCQRSFALGGACVEDFGRSGVCPERASCTPNGDAWRCVTNGAEGGRCRSASPVCDDGLACVRTLGVPVCVREPTIGVRGGRCGAGAVDRCAAGLVCDGRTGRCVDSLPLGAACVLASDTCAPGLRCYRASVVGEQGVCVASGVLGGLCHALPPRCGEGLLCVGREPPVCARPVADGARCDLVDLRYACDGACDAGVCRARGRLGGPCRAADTACDGGLTCVRQESGNVCVQPVALLARCSSALSQRCPPGASCRLPSGGGQGVCQDNGTLAPPCDDGGACPSGRRCVRGLCRPVVADGASCFESIVCAAGSTCLYPQNSVFAGQCVRDGALGAACRSQGAPCDAPAVCRPVLLTPWHVGQCVLEAGVGEACGTQMPPRPCAAGLRCDNGRCG